MTDEGVILLVLGLVFGPTLLIVLYMMVDMMLDYTLNDKLWWLLDKVWDAVLWIWDQLHFRTAAEARRKRKTDKEVEQDRQKALAELQAIKDYYALRHENRIYDRQQWEDDFSDRKNLEYEARAKALIDARNTSILTVNEAVRINILQQPTNLELMLKRYSNEKRGR